MKVADGDPGGAGGGRAACVQIPGVTHVVENFLDPTFEDSRFADTDVSGGLEALALIVGGARRRWRASGSPGCCTCAARARPLRLARRASAPARLPRAQVVLRRAVRPRDRAARCSRSGESSSNVFERVVIGGMVSGTALAVRAGNSVVRVAQTGLLRNYALLLRDRRHGARPLLPGGEPLMLSVARSSCRSPAACWRRCCRRAAADRGRSLRAPDVRVASLFAARHARALDRRCSPTSTPGSAACSTSRTSPGSPSSASTTSSASTA